MGIHSLDCINHQVVKLFHIKLQTNIHSEKSLGKFQPRKEAYLIFELWRAVVLEEMNVWSSTQERSLKCGLVS